MRIKKLLKRWEWAIQLWANGVKQLWEERAGKTPQAAPMTPEQRAIRELKKQVERLALEK
jgi:hypothetical protein